MAYGPGDRPGGAKPTPPRAVKRARAQEQAYASQGVAVKKVARKQKLAAALPKGPPPPPRPIRVRSVEQAERASERKRAKRVQLSGQRKRTGADRPIIVKRREKVARQQDLEQALAIITAPKREEPLSAGKRSLLGKVTHAVGEAAGEAAHVTGKGLTEAGKAAGYAVSGDYLSEIGLKAPKGGAGALAHDIARNAPSDAAELAVTTPSSVAKLVTTAATEPEKLPGLLIEPYKELARDPAKFVRERPVTAALMIAPGVRLPGRAAGKVARLAGKQTLEREPARIAGTPLRVARTGPRGAVSGFVSARRERGAEAPELTGRAADREVNRAVDEFVGYSQKYVQRVESAAAKQAHERGLEPEAAREHVSGAAAGARQRMDTAFSEQFGSHEAAAQRYARHKTIGSSKATLAIGLRQSRRAFTKTVLPFSTKWMTGQVTEAALRSLLQGAGPTSYLRGRRIISELERQAPGKGKELAERTLTGGLYGRTLQHGMTTKTLAEDLAHTGTGLADVGRRLTELGSKPGVKQVRNAHSAMTNFVFDTVNGTIERAAQTAMLGRAVKTGPLMERRVIGLSDRAVADAARGLHGTEAQAQLAREVQKAYGKYANFGPELRNAVMYWTPFLPWVANVGRFLTKTLPVEHPAYAALAADVDAATEQWRKANRLSLKSKHVPEYLLGGYPAGGGRIRRVGHYLPFAAEMSDPAGSLAGLLLPQFADAYQALQGKDWKGDPLHGEHGPEASQEEKVAKMVQALAEAMIPGLSVTKGTIEKGWRRQFVPWEPTKAPAPRVRRKRGRVRRKNPLGGDLAGFGSLR